MLTFPALLVEAGSNAQDVRVGIREIGIDDLPPGEVLIDVWYSGINYKDALATTPYGKVVRRYPMVPGIDLSGVVAESSSSAFREGDQVLVTGYDLGTNHYGGFSRYARVPAQWVVRHWEGWISLGVLL